MAADDEVKSQANPAPAKRGGTAGFYEERVLSVLHWTDRLFSFKTTRNAGLRFESGQFVMLGLAVDGRPLMRAYSVVSSKYDDWLEFLSIKVPNGPLTSRLQHIAVGDTVFISKKPTGTLLLEALEPGKRLYLFCTGTGFAPFGSVIRDPETYERFESVIVAYGCRQVADLAAAAQTVEAVRTDEVLSELVSGRLHFYDTVTREPYVHTGRLTAAIETGALFTALGVPPLDPANDRAMICGGPEMLADLRTTLLARGFTEGSLGEPGQFVIEKAFVEK